MGLRYDDLNEETRVFMIEEIDMDAASERIYLSSYLSEQARVGWATNLLEAARSGSDETLAAQLRATSAMNLTAMRRKPSGGFTEVRVPHNAAEVLAESEFNRFYVRGLCRRAIASGVPPLEVYRAKAVAQPRPESERRVGLLVDPEKVLSDLRENIGVETALGIPPGPGSGISLRFTR